MAKEVSKSEFLKRYLEKDSHRKSKKKSKSVKSKSNVSRLKIIDQDIGLKSINFDDKIEVDDGDEAPLIAEVIDERPMEEKLKEYYDSSRWKKIDDEVSQAFSMHKSDSDTSRNQAKSISSNEKSSSKRHDSDNDVSPPHRGTPNKSASRSNSQTKRHDSGSDISPPRHRTLDKPASQSNSKRKRHDSGSDISPHRQSSNEPHGQVKNLLTKHNSDSDISPPRHHTSNRSQNQVRSLSKNNSDSDISPPREQAVSRSHSQDRNLLKRRDPDSDISPPRHQTLNKLHGRVRNVSKRHGSDSDISPPRHQSTNKSNRQVKSSPKKWDTHNSLNLHKKKLIRSYDSDSDEAPAKYSKSYIKSSKNKSEYQKNSDSDMSPPRSSSELSAVRDTNKKMAKTLSGLKAGLQNAKALQHEVVELRKKEKKQLNMLDDELSGRNADTIIRDRHTGMKRDLKKEEESKAEEIKKAKEYEQKYSKWGKGIEQEENNIKKFQDDMYEMSKPLARYRDDEDLDERLKLVIHDDDPMSEYIKRKRRKDTPSTPMYSGPPAPPNRFSILPGYRWDGVDRSNGFEKKYFEKINSSKALKDEAYMWSVQDM